ncbi:MAG: hypothetical protein ACYCSQ_09735 [bacterium]
MEIKPKSNIMLYLTSETDNFFHLSPWDVFDQEFGSDGYTYLLPKSKAHFKFISQDQELIVFVEKIDEIKKEVHLSQIHWLYMKNLIKSELELDVKIIKSNCIVCQAKKLTCIKTFIPHLVVFKHTIKYRN